MNEIELIPTDDLVAELFRRHSAVLIVRQMPVKTTTEDDTMIDYCGGLNTALGLGMRATSVLTNRASKSMVDPKEDDDGE